MAEKQKLTTMEEHFAKHLKLAGELTAAKGKSVSSTLASLRSSLMSDGKVKARKSSDLILAGFKQEMKKLRGGG